MEKSRKDTDNEPIAPFEKRKLLFPPMAPPWAQQVSSRDATLEQAVEGAEIRAASFSAPLSSAPTRDGVSWWIEGLEPDDIPEKTNNRTLEEHVRESIQRNFETFNKKRGNENISSGDRELYRSPTRILVGLMKSHAAFEGLNEDQALDTFEAVLSRITEAENPWEGIWTSEEGDEFYIPHEDTFDNPIDPWVDFLHNWAEWRPGKKPILLDGAGLQRAQEFAEKYPVCSAVHRSMRDQAYLRIVSLCFWLARLRQNIEELPTFFLGTRDAGSFAGCSHATAGKHLSRARRAGLLALENAEDRNQRKAQEFSFNFEMVSFSK